MEVAIIESRAQPHSHCARAHAAARGMVQCNSPVPPAEPALPLRFLA